MDHLKAVRQFANLWQRATENISNNVQAEHLRSQYELSRSYASKIATEIARDLPDYTVHDITHIDALWESAETICGSDYVLTPTEVFVLGIAILVHDLAMGSTTYPDGLAGLRRSDRWKDALVAELHAHYGRYPSLGEIESPPDEVISATQTTLLREMHAEQAASMPTRAFRESDGAIEYFLIADPDLRNQYGHLAGQLASSHWWDSSRITKEFGVKLGAPAIMPHDWTVDPLVLACIVRAADASQLDSRRAPGFLRAIRKPRGASRPHWIFQERLQRPRLDADRLVYTAAKPFSPSESDAWWLCYDSLKMVDRELRAVDAILADTGRARFAARSVARVDDPKRFSSYVPVDGWYPIDARIRVGDVLGLVRRLGGAELYGDDPQVPLRELISNAADAVRAKKCLLEQQGFGSSEISGNVTVRIFRQDDQDWLSVRDTGIGMSAHVMADALLNFGSSYWESTQARNDLTGLLASGFRPTGQYGIGFFSIFMLGDSVKVISRRYDASMEETHVLEFIAGLESRPILRTAQQGEKLLNGGTEVCVKLKNAPVESGGILRYGDQKYWRLSTLCAWLCPTLDVDLEVVEDGQRKSIIIANDWLELPAVDLVQRLYSVPDNQKYMRILTAVESVRDVVVGDRLVGRAALWSSDKWRLGVHAEAPVTVGGVRSKTVLQSMIGVFVGTSKRAARDEAEPIVSKVDFSEWASDQAVIGLGNADLSRQSNCAARVHELFGNVGDLCFVETRAGWLNSLQLEEYVSGFDEVLLVQDAEWSLMTANLGDDVQMNENVIVIDMGRPSFLAINDKFNRSDRFPYWDYKDWGESFHERSLVGLAIKSISIAWHLDPSYLMAQIARNDKEEQEVEDDPDWDIEEGVGEKFSAGFTQDRPLLVRGYLLSKAVGGELSEASSSEPEIVDDLGRMDL